MKLELLGNDGDHATIGRAIEESLDGALTFDAAVAFVKRSGIAAAPGLQGFARTNRVRLLAGTDFSQTEVEAIDDLSSAGAESRVFVERFVRSQPSARHFHSKLYVARGPKRVVAIVGSANLTRGGLATNREACLRVEGDAGEPVLAETTRLFETLWQDRYSVPVDDRFRHVYRILQESRRRTELSVDADEATRRAASVLRAHLTSLVTGARPLGAGSESPRCWILVTSLANFEVCRDRQLWGDTDEGRIRLLRDGDPVAFYIKGVKRLGGLALVRGLPFSIGQSPWEESRYAWAIHVEFLLSPETTIDFERLVPSLSFIRNKRAWGTSLQGFLREVPHRDFEILRRALAAATIGEELPRVAEGDG